MTTINQLIRKLRQSEKSRSEATALMVLPGEAWRMCACLRRRVEKTELRLAQGRQEGLIRLFAREVPHATS